MLAIVLGAWQACVDKKRLKHEQAPQRRAVIANAGLMRIDQVPKVGLLKVARLRELRIENRIANTLLQGAAEPLRKRDGEAHLRAIHDLPRQVRLHRFLQQVLALLAADLERSR